MSGSNSAFSISPVAYVDATGIHVPAYSDVLTFIQNGMRAIYGQDLYLENDSQDGQLAALFAKAVHDCNSAMLAVYNAFSPSTAQGNGLSSVVKINGITRLVPTNSEADVFIEGDIGTLINSGIVYDENGNNWNLPVLVEIGTNGTVTATATCQTAGAITAVAGTITGILTPTRGWLTVTNNADATPGQPDETDSALRQRQSISAALPASSTADGLRAAIGNVVGVTRFEVYENTGAVTDANGIPRNSVAAIVDGGDANAIANLILLKRGQGCGTFGTTSLVVADPYGIPHTINFSRPIDVPITIVVRLKALFAYTTSVGTAIVAAIVAYAEAQQNQIGSPVYLTRLYASTNLPVSAGGMTYDITGITISRPLVANDAYGNVPMAFNEAPVFSALTTSILVVP